MQIQIIATPALPPHDAIQLVKDAIKFYCFDTIDENVNWNIGSWAMQPCLPFDNIMEENVGDVTDKNVFDD